MHPSPVHSLTVCGASLCPPDSGAGPREDRPAVPQPCARRSSWSADITHRAGKAVMEPESLYNLLQLPGRVDQAAGVTLSQGEKKKFLPPTSRKDPKLEELQKVLTEWINAKLLPEHIVVRSLEEDIFDGLILHHLFQKLTGVKLDVEEIALTAASQRRKLAVVLEAAGQSLQVEEPQAQWSVESIFNKDLLATLHLLVALAKCFQPDLSLPTNVKVEVIIMESTKSGLKSEMSVEQLTECGTDKDQPSKDVFDELFKLAPEKVNAVKEAIVNFVNQKLDRLGLSVQNLDTQFADGVILLLLIGQLEGFFLHLKEFYLTPKSPAEMLHNVTLALELLKDEDLLNHPVSPEDIVNKDTKSTLRVLYGLFRKHKLKESTDGEPLESPN
ncbi:gamma-parvin isoform X1 [Lagenorhynchus albirostris]|uniref:gamma-parvin isoform X1 n=2 Tax=Lagenorhynchus albirostris TaxID=27610 RepID=UPI0028E92B55|nr:gamma-parvin isoform X1 [Lagenorhynchus albirostris]